ncbi:MAG: AMP-binding protein [Candidatus Zixiibacteriota bacterium]|nr:MAG: AMP-binding protein [candidate division Zixibacteria bacterium]
MTFFQELNKFGDNIVAIEPGGEKYSYRSLVTESDRFIENLDTVKKKLVFILCRNCFEALVGYIGSLRSASAGILLPSTIDKDSLDNLTGLYKPDYVWRPVNSGNGVFNFKNYSLERTGITRDEEIHSDLVLLLSTSGSTGSPKMVRLTASNIDENASSIAEYLKLHEDERPITTLPMHYSYGLSVINSHLKVGATLLLTNDSLVSRPFWNYFLSSKATSIAGVPYNYEILRRIKFFKMDLGSLKTMTQAGGKLTPKYALEFAEFAEEKKINFFIMYGQTEATARISYLPPEDALEKYRSIGIAIPGGAMSLIDDNGNTINDPNIQGELVYQGPNVMLGYATSVSDLAKGDELKGVLKTGDIAFYDEDGYFYVTGRKKRFIKIYGNRVNLDEIEHFLKEQGYNGVCGGKDDQMYIAITDNGKAEAVKNIISGKYGFHPNSFRIKEVTEIYKSTSGKILYEKIFKDIGN